MKTITCQVPSGVREVQVLVLRDAPPVSTPTDTPERVANLMREHWSASPGFNPDTEGFWVLFLNTRRVVTGIHKVADGTLDTLLIHPREVFKAAIVMSAAAIVLCHNHPSGDSTPSEADIKVTRDLIKGGQLLKIEVLDHVIVIPHHSKHTQPHCGNSVTSTTDMTATPNKTVPLGQTVMTCGINAMMGEIGLDVRNAMFRHAKGDWGEVNDEDKASNDAALVDGDRLVSAYTATNGTKFWIITECDRSVTTVLLPEEY